LWRSGGSDLRGSTTGWTSRFERETPYLYNEKVAIYVDRVGLVVA